MVYDNFACLKELETVTDLSELENAKDAVSGKSVKEVLEAGLPAPISELVDDKNATDNAGGKYEVIKITTATPFPYCPNSPPASSARSRFPPSTRPSCWPAMTRRRISVTAMHSS